MFSILLLATLVISVTVSYLVVRVFRQPIDKILSRIIADSISAAWVTYVTFGLYVVGISSGVRINDLERYVALGSIDIDNVPTLTLDRGVLELYRTIISALQGLAAVLLLFFIVALAAFVVVKVVETKKG